MSNGPVEPSADMRMFASNLRQMYLALTQEGFTTIASAFNGGGGS